MPDVLVLADRLRGALDDSVWELLGLGRALCGGGRVGAVLLGQGAASAAPALAAAFDQVWVFDDERLGAHPDGEAAARLLAPFLARERPFLTLLAHTNLALDLAPALAERAGLPLLPDVVALEVEGARVRATRAIHGGKVLARLEAGPSPAGFLVSVRAGVAPAAPAAGGAGRIQAEALPASFAARRRVLRVVEEEAGAVDIASAAVLVGVGRGVGEEENLAVVRALAEALGGELACSRPVVDKGWLPKSRQVGTSGVTVRPRLYVAVGISGSFQHVGGIKGAPYVVAVNTDPRAPIFAVADVGVVGDLLAVVPALEAKVREARA